MSSSDEEEVVKSKPQNNGRKRKRLLSEDHSENCHEVVELDETPTSIHHDDSADEITIIDQRGSSNGTTKRIVTLDSDEEELGDEDDDDDDDERDDADREDDAIIEELYEDEDQPKQSSAAQKRIKGLRDTVADFFQTASSVDMESIPGVSKKKVEQLLSLRPILSWDDLNKKIQNHKSAGINEDVVINAVKTIKSRQVVEKLMNDCQKLAQGIGQLVDKLPEASQPTSIPEQLKLAPYQLVGLNWLALMHSKGVNGILADEMGLGKTIQVIAFLAYLRERMNLHRHHLVIVPASTIDNWEREFDNWCPDIRLLQYYGTQEYRAQVRSYVSKNSDDVDVILTTYNVAQNPEDRKLFKKIPLEYLIFDEAHMLKNMKSGRYQSLIKIRSKRRILLTGTPLQNNLVELMSLLVFAMPRMLMSKMAHVEALFSSASREEGGRTQFEKERIEQAKKIMKPFVLRRLKKDVLKDLPKKSEETVLCQMSPHYQAGLYKKITDSFKREIKDHVHDLLEDDKSFSSEADQDTKKGAGMLMALRKAANHPLLMQNLYTKDKLKQMASILVTDHGHCGANKDLIYEDMCVMHDFELHKLCQGYEVLHKFQLSKEQITDSGKFNWLDKLLEDLTKREERCLIFSQFVIMLDIIEEYLKIRRRQYLRLDGTTKVSERIELIDRFNADSRYLVFLLSTKAGGLGINLTAASVVVIHDIDFNPYNDKQAEDRSHRLGQTRDVKVYKLISKGTVEDGMLEIATEKLKLGKNISEQEEEDTESPNTTKDMRSLLRISLKLR